MPEFDFSEVRKLAADLDQAPLKAGPKIRKAVEASSREVKDRWSKKLRGEPRLPHAPRSIGYDIKSAPGRPASRIESEIGAERGKLQAPIVTVIEFGSPTQNLAPREYGKSALQETEDDFVKGLTIAIEPEL